ncbi:hypothetical protein [Haloarcula onubensis]|nr:hypothetical protein [Halomicroarcula sp. S3CR25-11]
MMTEREYCDDYVSNQSEEYEREVPVGNILLRDVDSLPDAGSGSLSCSIDRLHTPSDIGRERLVECKKEPTFQALGQLLIYTYLRRRDRELIWDKYNRRDGGWEAKTDISRFDSHVYKTDKRYHVKPLIENINQILVIGEVDSSDSLLLSTCLDFGIQVEHRTSGTWRELSAEIFQTKSTDRLRLTSEWLQTNSRSTLDSSAEEKLWDNASDRFEGGRVFKEVPVGSTLYQDRPESHRADVMVRAKDHWFIVEVKKSTNESAMTDFQQAFGQATSYANLFAREWGIPSDHVAPVVIQDPLALLGGVYRQDRYGEDYHTMRDAAFADSSEPFILGSPQTFAK